jgi:hypothetical protein
MGQTYVKELTSVDLRQKLEEETETALEESMMPIGIIDRGEAVDLLVIAAKKNDDSWIFAGDDDFDARMMSKHDAAFH